jgi:hypothetical protein
MNGFDSHSFHQNCLSTRRQRGSDGYGSPDALTLSNLCVDCGLTGDSLPGKASNSASSVYSFRDLESRSCLCCRERVMSEEYTLIRGILSEQNAPNVYAKYISPLLNDRTHSLTIFVSSSVCRSSCDAGCNVNAASTFFRTSDGSAFFSCINLSISLGSSHSDSAPADKAESIDFDSLPFPLSFPLRVDR